MENHFMLTDELLWDYADGFLNGEEKLRVEAYLQQNPAQNARLEAILNDKRNFLSLDLERPQNGFAQQVMAAWATEQAAAKIPATAKAAGRDWILWSITAAFGLMILVPFWFSRSAASTGLDLEIPAEYVQQIQVPTVDWTGIFSSAMLQNALLLGLAFMSLKLLDKYLQVRNLRLAGH
ncbi:MAG: hypothetical protein Q7U74_11205 [Saprospiraceae bacterium]|nr:hypothetical protein [Saprospiraceae bacterium]